jgi:hypothetical protein
VSARELADLWRESVDGSRAGCTRETASAAAAALLPPGCALLLLTPDGALARTVGIGQNAGTVFDPSTFQPVCGASDGVYRTLQGVIQAMVGEASYREYSPLIAGSLLRVRLELCVVESFFNEAIAPFIRSRGLSWVLPLHETVETFLAGVVFAVATNFILIGSTKIITVLVTYTDVFVGFPIRLVSGVAWCARRRPATRTCVTAVHRAERTPRRRAATPPPPRSPHRARLRRAGTPWPSRCVRRRSRQRRQPAPSSGCSAPSSATCRRSRRSGSTRSRPQARADRARAPHARMGARAPLCAHRALTRVAARRAPRVRK